MQERKNVESAKALNFIEINTETIKKTLVRAIVTAGGSLTRKGANGVFIAINKEQMKNIESDMKDKEYYIIFFDEDGVIINSVVKNAGNAMSAVELAIEEDLFAANVSHVEVNLPSGFIIHLNMAN